MTAKLRYSFVGMLATSVLLGCGRARKPEVSQVAPTAPEAGSVIAPIFQPEAGSTIRSLPEAGSVSESGRWLSPSFTPPKVKPQPKRMIAAISSEQRRFNELSAILANRELHRAAQNPSPLPESSPPNVPPELRHIYEAIHNIHMTKVDGDWLPVVSLFKSTEMLEQVFALEFDRAWGLRITLTAETESAIRVLEEQTPRNLVHLSLTLNDVSDAGCRRLSVLPNVNSLELEGIFSTEQLQLLLELDHFESVTIVHLGQEFDTHQIAEILRPLNNLKRFTIDRSPPNAQPNMMPIYEALTIMSQLEHVSIRAGIASEESVIKFLTEGDRMNLKTLAISSEPLDWSVWDLHRIPNVERLSLCMSPRSDWIVKAVNILSHAGNIRSLRLVPYTDDMKEAEPYHGATAAKLIGALSRHTALEDLQIPIKVDSPEILEGLTHLPHLKTLPVQGLDLNQKTLAIIGRMPKLEHLTVNKLEFGPESSHLMPWLTITSLHVDKQETLTDERAEMLGLAPRLRHISWWGGNGMTRFPDHIPHIEFQEYD